MGELFKMFKKRQNVQGKSFALFHPLLPFPLLVFVFDLLVLFHHTEPTPGKSLPSSPNEEAKG
jgi:hypothetical protein